MKKFSTSTYIDLGFCLVMLPLVAAMSPVERWFHNFTAYTIVAAVWLYLLYFINRVFTVPWLFGGRRKVMGGILLILLSVAVTIMMSRVRLYEPKPSIYDAGLTIRLPRLQQYQEVLWSLFMIVQGFSFAVGLLTETNIQRNRRLQAEAQRDHAEIEREKAEIRMYKARIKPHFMFNTLNSLYGLFLMESPNALSSLEKFIQMMRYIHTNADRDMVPLSEETDYIREYVEIQSLRLNDMTKVELHTAIESEHLTIPPMLLVTFVENCFKHGISAMVPSTIHISLTEHDGQLLFSTSNRIFPSSAESRDGDHMGVANCRRRLELLYPLQHSLSIGAHGNEFKVELLINLTHDQMYSNR